ncbi:unnamed protein product [Blepharisma stoltei]|uniref:phosphatidate phosphatase n=1 Tax=Blepharisma stoltei TaxID=1481888 RepID=A0AAU9KR89_9CILI|nr:unnamed protein product [Blepharisma stoltei]
MKILLNIRIMKKISNLVFGITDVLTLKQSTLSGALDVIVIEHEDKSLHCSPFQVRFGRLKVFFSEEKSVRLIINDKPSEIYMKLGKEGQAFFIDPKSEELNSDLNEIENINSNTDTYQRSPDIIMKELEKRPDIFKWPWGSAQNKTKATGYISSLLGYFRSQEKCQPGFEMSLCLDQLKNNENDPKIFEENKVSCENFNADPFAILNDPKLALKINGKIYDLDTAMPEILSIISSNENIDPNAKEIKKIKNIIEEEIVINKTLKLNSEQLKKLNLKKGGNRVCYRIENGLQSVIGKIYLWNWKSRMIASDIDGTITKSDVLGQVLPMVGKDWSHSGIVSFYNNIKKNGYKIVYISSRAIGQSEHTRGYLNSLYQDNQLLPDGPIIMSPDGIFTSFVREVIRRSPQKFKAEVLRDIAALFPTERNPWYAGFGNRDTDSIAYRAAGMPLHKIFLINSTGNVSTFNNTFVKTYYELSEISDNFFPPIEENTICADQEFNDLNYWRIETPVIISDNLD